MAEQFVFGPHRLDARERQLFRGQELVRIERKAFDLLHYLLSHAGTLVEKQELADEIWSGMVVTDNSLTRCVHQIRTALGDNAESPTFIETVPGSGYRFIAPVTLEDKPVSQTSKTDLRTSRSGRFVAVAVFVFVVIAVVTWVSIQPGDRDGPNIDRIAVLPLANLTGNAEQLYFVYGIHEALITELSRIEQIDVISRTSVMRYGNSNLSIPEIAAQLDVDAIIEGSVSRAGNNLTVTTQLVAVKPERNLWSERFHRSVSDVFEITTEVARAVASEIAVSLSAAEEEILTTARQVNVEAFDSYLLGKFHLAQRSREGYTQAANYFQHAVDIDPEFALAYVGLADTIGSPAVFGMLKPEDSYPRAKSFVETAIRLDSTLAEAHMTLAAVSFYWDWDWTAAENGARRALALNPSLADSYRFLSEVLSVTGRHEDALVAIERGRQLDPLSPISQFKPSLIHYLNRDYGEAIEKSRAALEFFPDFWQGHWLLCLSLSAAEHHAEAIGECEIAADRGRRTPMALGALGYAYAQGGQPAMAEQILAELEAYKESGYVGASLLAIIDGALGNFDQAFAELERAIEERDQLLIHVENYGFFDPLRSDERFANLVPVVH